MGLRRSFEYASVGVPHGPLGRVGAWMLASMKGRFFAAMATELDLVPDDELLDVGCGSAVLFVEHAAHVRYVAGLDASEIQVALARRRLADRIAAGTAEIILGDAAALPWEGGRFSVVTSLDAMKFVPDPEAALREMHRVLRPGGRAVITMGDNARARWEGALVSGTQDAWGIWQWSDTDAARMMERAGFADVAVSELPVFSKAKLVKAVKPAPSEADAAPAMAASVAEAVA